MKYRALVDLSIRSDKSGWLDIKAGEDFTPPKRMDIPGAIKQGFVEPIEKVKDDE